MAATEMRKVSVEKGLKEKGYRGLTCY